MIHHALLLGLVLLTWGLALAMGLMLLLLAARLGRRSLRPSGVALVQIEGGVGLPGFFGTGPSTLAVLREIAAANRDQRTRGLLVRIDSPGGAVGATEEIARELERFRQSGRPIVVSVGNQALSGGFWLAMEGDLVVAPSGALLGSIGVIVQKPELHRLFAMLGISREVAKSREHKDFMSPFRGWDDEERRFLDDINQEIFERFVSRVAERRRLPRAEVMRVADGRVFTGDKAKAWGFVDELGNFEDALRLLRQRAGLAQSAPVRTYRRGPWSRLFE